MADFILPEMSELFGGHALCNYASILRPRISDWRSKVASEPENKKKKLYFVTKIVLTYCEKKNVLVFEKKLS